MRSYILALDQGTTSSRAILYDLTGKEIALSQKVLSVTFPHDGWVEQNPTEIWTTLFEALKEVTQGVLPQEIEAIGITNQRETLVVWDPADGKPLAPAIVWQCRRSSEICVRLRNDGLAEEIRKTTGLVIDPYFSGTKALWMIENVPGLKAKVVAGKAIFGTVDTWILYQLTEGKSYLTEPSNASRTMLFSLAKLDWDEQLLKRFSLSRNNLPLVASSVGHFGVTRLFGREIPITGMLGDQQAALFGQGCFEKHQAKVTFGTGAFLLMNTANEIVQSTSGLLSAVFWAEEKNRAQYAVEGSVFIAGALIQWLRDKLGILRDAAASETKAASVADSAGVVIVPAFVGLGAPYWDDTARGTIFGLTRETGSAHLVRAALESVGHQVADLIAIPELAQISTLRIDGGMSRNKLFNQILSNLTQRVIEPAVKAETTALGAAGIAALGAGVFSDQSALCEKFLRSHGRDRTVLPQLSPEQVAQERKRWREAVRRTQAWQAQG